MQEYPLSYREVIPEQGHTCKEITLSTGGTQSTLQDIKVSERANGYCYRDATKYYTRNRFIHWRINHNYLEIMEQSLDVNLSGNKIRYKFLDTPILDGVTIHETYYNVVVLVPTVCSVHRLLYPHPDRLHISEDSQYVHRDISIPSIFADVSQNSSSLFYVYTNPGVANSQLPHSAASSLTISSTALFLFAYPNNELLLVRQPPVDSTVTGQPPSGGGNTATTGETIELRNESRTQRFLSGLAGKLLSRGGGGGSTGGGSASGGGSGSGVGGSGAGDGSTVVSVLLHQVAMSSFAVALTRDGRIQVWDCDGRGQCVADSDVLVEYCATGRQTILGAQNHILQSTHTSSTLSHSPLLAVYLSYSSGGSQFHILRPFTVTTNHNNSSTSSNSSGGGSSPSQYRLERLYTLDSPLDDLIDYGLTGGRLWAVYRDVDGLQPTGLVTTVCLERAGGNGGGESTGEVRWQPVTLETQPHPDEMPAGLNGELDAREGYLEYIFYPGRFPLQIISKALSIYKRSALLGDVKLSAQNLRQRISIAVETEIQNELKETEVTDEDYIETASRCWSRFFSCCVQYHVTGLRPLGILLLPAVSGAVLLKKDSFSILRPLDILEHLSLCTEHVQPEQFLHCQEFYNVNEELPDLIHLVKMLSYLDEQFSDEFKTTFERELLQFQTPEVVVKKLLPEILQDIAEIHTLESHINESLPDFTHFYQTLHKLLSLLRMDSSSPLPHSSNPNPNPTLSPTSTSHLFSSPLGVSLITRSLAQQMAVRYTLCRQVLVLQCLLVADQYGGGDSEGLRTVCMPEAVMLVRGYYAMGWVAGVCGMPVLPTDSCLQRLSSLKLTPVYNLKSNPTQPTLLLELFAASTGGSEAHTSFATVNKCDEEGVAHWHNAMLPYLEQLTHVLWPINGNHAFPEWLLVCGQHLRLQQYVGLLNNWCINNDLTRSFILAISFLVTGEKRKSYNLFAKSSKGVYSEQYIVNRIPNYSPDGSRPFILFYLKVIQLFELHGYLDCAMDAAKAALTVENIDPILNATLHSILFKHQLALGHYNKAYEALVANPDVDRKKDNLRDLVKCLLDQKRLDILISFPYYGLEKLFCNILFTRARATDNINNIYYDFLYAYQVKQGTQFMRLAANIMYEQAYRLLQHDSVDALEKQVKCYLAAVNCLHLTEERFRWCLRPSDPDLEETNIEFPVEIGSNKEPEKFTFKKKIEVIELDGIKNELELACARLKLARYDENTSANHLTSPEELKILLVNAGLFKTALNLCKRFSMPYDLIFESLTRECIKLPFFENPNSWNWLAENDLQELAIIGNTPSDSAWSLLKNFISEFEKENMTVIHKVVILKMIKMRTYIPYWITASYKLRNPSELLRVLYHNGYLDDACALATQHLMAAMGSGKEHFGYVAGISASSNQFCLPLNVIEALIDELDQQNIQNADKPFLHVVDDLRNMFTKYIQISTQMSDEYCRYKLSSHKI